MLQNKTTKKKKPHRTYYEVVVLLTVEVAEKYSIISKLDMSDIFIQDTTIETKLIQY